MKNNEEWEKLFINFFKRHSWTVYELWSYTKPKRKVPVSEVFKKLSKTIDERIKLENKGEKNEK